MKIFGSASGSGKQEEQNSNKNLGSASGITKEIVQEVRRKFEQRLRRNQGNCSRTPTKIYTAPMVERYQIFFFHQKTPI